uniref:Uncharacterized protein n=1 Tax=Rhizophora mucronata TaxID=61149 RepID=A0A2P2Q5S8_RHIMU
MRRKPKNALPYSMVVGLYLIDKTGILFFS